MTPNNFLIAVFFVGIIFGLIFANLLIPRIKPHDNIKEGAGFLSTAVFFPDLQKKLGKDIALNPELINTHVVLAIKQYTPYPPKSES